MLRVTVALIAKKTSLPKTTAVALSKSKGRGAKVQAAPSRPRADKLSPRALAKQATEASFAKAVELSNAPAVGGTDWWYTPLKHRHLVILVDGHAMMYRCFYNYERFVPVDQRSEEASTRWANQSVRNYIASLISLRPPKADRGLHYHVQLITLLDGGKYVRTDVLPSYKTNRDAIRRPEIDFFIGKAMERLRGMTHISVIPTQRGDFAAEADDLIYTVVEKCKTIKNTEVIVASHDKDLFQLIDTARGVHYYNIGSKMFFNEAAVQKKIGVLPNQVQDYLSLLGDVSDAIPGVEGLGKVRAAKLLQIHGDMKTIFAKAREGNLTGVPTKIAQGILPFEERAFKMRNEVVALRHVPEVFQQLKLACDVDATAGSPVAAMPSL